MQILPNSMSTSISRILFKLIGEKGKGMHQVPQNRLLGEQCFFITVTLKNRRVLFLDDENANKVIESLMFFREQGELKLYGYVVMPDHVHFVVKLEAEGSLPRIIRRFKTHIANAIGQGPIWLRGYWSELIGDIKYLEQKLEYIHQNPVKAGLVQNATEYRFSSAGEYFCKAYSELVDNYR